MFRTRGVSNKLNQRVGRRLGALFVALGMFAWVSCTHQADAGTLTVIVDIKDPGVRLVLNDDTVEFGGVRPGDEAVDTIAGTVRSAKPWQMVYAATDLVSPTDCIPINELTLEGTMISQPIVMSRGGVIYSNMPKATGHGFAFTHTYRLILPWTVDPGVYRGTIVYSVSQM